MGDGIFSGPHLIIVAIVFVALFGASKLPIFARSLGQSMRIFKSEVRGLKEDDEAAAAPVQPVIAARARRPGTGPDAGRRRSGRSGTARRSSPGRRPAVRHDPGDARADLHRAALTGRCRSSC